MLLCIPFMLPTQVANGGGLFSSAPLQDLEKDVLSQDTSMLGNGHDTLVLSGKNQIDCCMQGNCCNKCASL